MRNPEQPPTYTQRIATLLAAGDTDGLRAELVLLLEQPGAIVALRALDQAGLLTQIIPELEPARATDQPHVHFLPVLAHMLETVAAVEWLLSELQVAKDERPTTSDQRPLTTDDGRSRDHPPFSIPHPASRIPVAVQTHPELRYQSVYAEELRQHFAEPVDGFPRVALFKLAALLHDIAKPATKRAKAGGGVSFHEHQTIGGEMALAVAQRLGFEEGAARYIRLVVREHMRPGQLGVLDAVTLKAVARFFHATAGAGPEVLLHLLADHMATRGPQIKVAAWLRQAAWVDALLDTIWGEVIEPTPPLLNGDQLMRALGIAPGPLVGRLLAAIDSAQTQGSISTPEAAIRLAKTLLEQPKV
jgi:poly(A) polymerase/tRNA nucleotidyltransferase (CCA-adding enzyme)